MITYKIFTDKGGRDVNEDSAGAAVSDAGVCFVLCDGLGGHGKGEVASYIVVESIKSDFAVCSDPDNFLPYAFENAQKRLMEEQKKQGAVNPAQIINHFTDPEQQSAVAGLFNAAVKVENPKEFEKAVQETIYKVVEHAIAQKSRELDPTDMKGLQELVDAKRRLQEIRRLHISL